MVLQPISSASAQFNIFGDSNPQREARHLLDEARITVERARNDREFGTAPQLLRRARAVLVVPDLVKGGFIVGGEGGRGVMIARGENGWGDPVFYRMISASVGLQIGVQTSQVVMFIMTDRAFRALREDNFKFGAQASLAVVTIGSNVQAGSTTDLNADIFVWAKAAGAFAGLTLEGTGIEAHEDLNHGYYGGTYSPNSIFAGRHHVNSTELMALRRALGG